MTARISLTHADPEAFAGFAQAVPATVPPAPGPGPALFAGVTALIKSVFAVPAVAILLDQAPSLADHGVFRAFLERPLLRNGHRIGTLRILDSAPRRFDQKDSALLDGFARLVVEQVDLWEQASRDMLTGALSRRAFLAALDTAFAARQRQRSPQALILFDLDHFKRVNDTFGHAAGDAVLQAAAHAVQGQMRQEDSFGRVGGEEFAVLVCGADAAIALDVADRLRQTIAGMKVPGHDGLHVTASFGVVALEGSAPSAAAVMEAADVALYAAKSGGRNRVHAG